MRLSHYTREEDFIFDKTREYEQNHRWAKPAGFWLSVDGDWERWCKNEGLDDWLSGNDHEFKLVDESRVLFLTSEDEILDFHKSYVLHNQPDFVLENGRRFKSDYSIDWEPLAREHAGIIIAPYIWSLRLDWRVNWYYPWDCASGCIWDLSVLEMVDSTVSS